MDEDVSATVIRLDKTETLGALNHFTVPVATTNPPDSKFNSIVIVPRNLYQAFAPDKYDLAIPPLLLSRVPVGKINAVAILASTKTLPTR